MTRESPQTDEDLLALRHGTPEERAHLARRAGADADLARRLEDWDRQDAALRLLYAPAADEPVPARLTEALRPAASAPAAAPVRRPGRARSGRLSPVIWWPWRAAAAVALIGLGFGSGFWMGQVQAPAGDMLARAAMGSFVTYAVEVAHPVEVPASDQAHLVAWLSKRLGQPITVPDLGAQGFRLLGGRLLPGPSTPAALMMYEDAMGRRLALYLTRSEGTESDLAFAEEPGAQAFWWVEGSLGCALVGDLPRDTLRHLAVAAYHALTAT